MPAMARTRFRGPAAVSVALTAWDVWRRLPPSQRRLVAALARKHGVRVAKQAWTVQRRATATAAPRADLGQRGAHDPLLLAQVSGRIALLGLARHGRPR